MKQQKNVQALLFAQGSDQMVTVQRDSTEVENKPIRNHVCTEKIRSGSHSKTMLDV